MAGPVLTVTGSVVLAHPPEEVKVKVAVPGDTPVTIPALVTVATVGLLLAQVPPDVGKRTVVPLPHIELGPVKPTKMVLTFTAGVTLLQPPEEVKVKFAVPVVTPVTTPPLVTEATAGLLLTQLPPVVGDKVVVPFTQIEADPVIVATGAA
jgi:hypothetical protein